MSGAIGGMVELTPEEMVTIAEVVYATMVAWAVVSGDDTHPAWKDAPFPVRNRCVNGVKAVLERGPGDVEAVHEAWRTEQLRRGWTYGPEFNQEARTHPKLVPFRHLDAYDRIRDRLFAAVVWAQVEMVG